MSQTPSFTANLFSGPCFGDMTPPEPSTPIHAPSPSPLPASTNLIELSTIEENPPDSMSNDASRESAIDLLPLSSLPPPLLDDPAPMEFETVSLQDEISSENAITSAPDVLAPDMADNLFAAETEFIPEDRPLTPPTYDMHPIPNSPERVPDSVVSTLPVGLTPMSLFMPEDQPLTSSTYSIPNSPVPNTAVPVGLTPMPLEADACSSPPSSSPSHIFSSSPPAASDSSVYPEDVFESPHKTAFYNEQAMTVNDSDPITSTSSPSSSPVQNDESLEVPPLSSSPLPSSSPPLPRSSPSPEEIVHSSPSPQPAEPSSPPNVSHIASSSLTCEEDMPSETVSPNVVETPEVKFEEISQVAATPLLNSAATADSEDAEMSKKRKREEESGLELGQNTTPPPNPKRPTLQSQKLQRMTLVKPFRSPAMSKPKVAEPSPPPPKQETASAEQPRIEDLKKKHRTQRAAGQFKSPLSSAVSASLPSVRPTPTIQSLESKVQVLKRAIKIKKEGEAETLEGLVKKWTDAGREVAWEVWGLVKDNEVGGGDDWGKDNDADHATAEEEEEEKPKETMGTMLMRLGIAPSTLGWNEAEEEFSDHY
ncbi:hypothetical protein FB45DRAFT_1054814 [Roridomyces roridus]|uniref:Uncharacterized protein n=1 Tax=Roridomyces roridus TaxID=1738132 RepID=A0AAD7C4E9_9AGAR|nr:hypothetical protein FB45DRAFT_1054814 [Roridomyces roridus]